MIEILNRWTNAVIYRSKTAETVKAAVEEAIRSGTSLSDANLRAADLRAADLRAANLSAADLSAANLSAADLRDANLRDANLRAANLRDANLRDAKNSELAQALTVIAPQGELDVFKKTVQGVVRLRIPREAARSNATGRKCRAEYALVIETPNHAPATSMRDGSFVYREGDVVRPGEWCSDRWQECAGGIHFFLTLAEAEAYDL